MVHDDVSYGELLELAEAEDIDALEETVRTELADAWDINHNQIDQPITITRNEHRAYTFGNHVSEELKQQVSEHPFISVSDELLDGWAMNLPESDAASTEDIASGVVSETGHLLSDLYSPRFNTGTYGESVIAEMFDGLATHHFTGGFGHWDDRSPKIRKYRAEARPDEQENYLRDHLQDYYQTVGDIEAQVQRLKPDSPLDTVEDISSNIVQLYEQLLADHPFNPIIPERNYEPQDDPKDYAREPLPTWFADSLFGGVLGIKRTAERLPDQYANDSDKKDLRLQQLEETISEVQEYLSITENVPRTARNKWWNNIIGAHGMDEAHLVGYQLAQHIVDEEYDQGELVKTSTPDLLDRFGPYIEQASAEYGISRDLDDLLDRSGMFL